MIGAVVVAVALVAANGFFVAAEFALVAARPGRIQQLVAEGDGRARAAQSAMGELSFMLSAAQMGITMASLGLGHVAEPAVASLLEGPLHALGVPEAAAHTVAFLLALAVVVFVHMVLGEMVPKSLAITAPEQTALWLALPMRAFTVVFRPLILALNGVANLGLRILRVEPLDGTSVAHTSEEIAGMLAVSRREGLLEEVEHRLMSGALGFAGRPVGEIMVPRRDIVAVGAGTSIEHVERRVLSSGHSRVPVFGRDLDDIIGFVHAKDLLEVDARARRRPVPPSMVRPMLVLSDGQRLPAALRAMRRARLHFALVTDASGRTVGIVTLEDVLEEVVGEIFDEHDEAQRRR